MRIGGLLLVASSCGAIAAGCLGTDLVRHHPGTDPDAGTDGGTEWAPDPPAPPAWTCPKGWRSVPDADVPDVAVCDPWPASGAEDCTGASAHFPGGKGCERVGGTCPAGPYADDAPVGAIHVDDDAVAGGDGSVARPYQTILGALAVATDGDVIAIARGTYEETPSIDRAVTLWGACAEETVITSSVPNDAGTTVRILGDATLRNLTVTAPRIGILVDGAAATLEGVVVHDTVAAALLVMDAGRLVASDLVVRDTAAGGNLGAGFGLDAYRGSHVELRRAAFERNRGAQIEVAEAGTDLVASDISIRGGLPGVTGDTGFGLEATYGATVTLERAAVEDNRVLGFYLIDADTTLTATDLVVRRTLGIEGDGSLGMGLDVIDGASATITGGLVEANRSVGSRVWGGRFVGTDLVVRDTQSEESDLAYGEAFEVLGGATLELTRAALLRNRSAGVLVGESSTLAGTDLWIASNLGRESDGRFGYGIATDSASQVTLTRALLEVCRRVALVAHHAGTVVHGEEVTVRGTLDQACGDACPDGAGGIGISAAEDGAIDLRGFLVEGSTLAGVQVASGSALDLHEGEIRSNPIGANVQDPAFDVDRLGDGVAFRDNDQQLDASAMPPPATMSALP